MASKGMAEVIEPIALGTQVAGGFVSAGASYAKSTADKTAYEIQATVADNNATIARAQSGDAIRRGQLETVKSGLRARQLKGQQIATMAANGVDLSTGSPLNILTDTDYMAATDADIIALNAAKEAWGFDVQASNAKNNADLLRYRAGMESPGRAAATSLLTSAGSVASKWYGTRRPLFGD